MMEALKLRARLMMALTSRLLQQAQLLLMEQDRWKLTCWVSAPTAASSRSFAACTASIRLRSTPDQELEAELVLVLVQDWLTQAAAPTLLLFRLARSRMCRTVLKPLASLACQRTQPAVSSQTQQRRGGTATRAELQALPLAGLLQRQIYATTTCLSFWALRPLLRLSLRRRSCRGCTRSRAFRRHQPTAGATGRLMVVHHRMLL